MLTEKQVRNGVPGPTATQNSAVPGPDATSQIAAAFGSITAAGKSGPLIAVSDGVVAYGSGVKGDV